MRVAGDVRKGLPQRRDQLLTDGCGDRVVDRAVEGESRLEFEDARGFLHHADDATAEAEIVGGRRPPDVEDDGANVPHRDVELLDRILHALTRFGIADQSRRALE